MKSFEEIRANAKRSLIKAKETAKTKIRDTYEWCCNNREEAAAIASFGIMVLGAVGKTVHQVDRKAMLKKEQDLKDLYVYDRSLGVYHQLRRKLRPSEIIEIDQRKAGGESMTSILSSMRLLK